MALAVRRENVRTYVRSADGESGIWFFSLDAARLGAVLVARSTYRLPYFWSHMQLERIGGSIRYECRRLWPGPRGAKSRVAVDIGESFDPSELSELDHFLTARWACTARPARGCTTHGRSTTRGHCTAPSCVTLTTS